MSKLRDLLLLAVKLVLIVTLLVYCTAWPGFRDFGSVENISVLTVILVTGVAFLLEAIAIQTFRRKIMKSIFWLLVCHVLTIILTVIEAICVFLYSQIASKNYQRLVAALQWTSACDPSLVITAEIFVKAISIAIVLLSLDEICTSAYLETNPESEPTTTGMHGTPYL